MSNFIPYHAILAHLPEGTVGGSSTGGAAHRGPPTTTDTSALFEELEEIRYREYAPNREENIEGLHTVDVSVRHYSNL